MQWKWCYKQELKDNEIYEIYEITTNKDSQW